MSFFYDIFVNLLASALWALGGFTILHFVRKYKKVSQTRQLSDECKKQIRILKSWKYYQQGSLDKCTRISYDNYDIDIIVPFKKNLY